MSPAALRTYRAERLLERDFHALRGQVLRIVRARLRTGGSSLDGTDLEACYASAWQGLYGATVRGEEVEKPLAWLALVTYRRAVEELRLSRHREAEPDGRPQFEPDLAAELDDRMRLRRLLEGMRCRLDLREREAAALCYLQGYSRAQAARRMGISETRMRKLMEGRGAGQAGVAAKVGVLVRAISDGEFCEQQASLMRAFAFGVLDPGGERHRIAAAHLHDCPACRRHVASLRGLAAVLPPVLTLPGAGKAGLAALAAGSSHGGALSTGGAAAGGAPLGASAAAGSGAAGGGWALGGGLATKLAAVCVLALGVGAGCVSLAVRGGAGARRPGRHAPAPARTLPATQAPGGPSRSVARAAQPARSTGIARGGGEARSIQAEATREFGPEGARRLSRAARRSGAANTAAAGRPRAPSAAIPASSPAASAAEREFTPG